MKMPSDKSIVLDIAGDKCVIHSKPEDVSILLREGFNFDEAGNMSIKIKDNSHRVQLTKLLIHMGCAFSSGRDWSPEEYVLFLIDQSVINLQFYSIRWKDQNNYQIF